MRCVLRCLPTSSSVRYGLLYSEQAEQTRMEERNDTQPPPGAYANPSDGSKVVLAMSYNQGFWRLLCARTFHGVSILCGWNRNGREGSSDSK